MSHPFFSVVITTFNRKNLLPRALDSLISQREKDWEAIIMDDGSTDDTYSRIIAYLEEYPEIKYFMQAHKGEASAKNAGIQVSKGKFITFLDSDDEYDPVHLKSRKEILERNPLVRFLFGGVKIIGNPYVPDRFNPGKRIHLKNCVIGGTFIIERRILTELEGFTDMKLGTDSDLFDRAKQAGVVMDEVALPTYIYHHENPDSVTNSLLSELT